MPIEAAGSGWPPRLAGPLADVLGTRRLLVQAPMAGAQDARLALAVCAAGGVGSLPAAMWDAATLTQQLQQMRQHAQGAAWNLNFFCHPSAPANAAAHARWLQVLRPFYDEAGLDAAAVQAAPGRAAFSRALADVVEPFAPPIVSFHFGLPAPDLLARVKSWGSVVLGCATTLAEAVWLQAHGADAVIAQGLEAGGHRGVFLDVPAHPALPELAQEQGRLGWDAHLATQLDTLALLAQVVAAVQVPVLAAGGVASAGDVRAALALGAAGVQVGTTYLCSQQATTSAVHRAALQAGGHTELTTVFTGRPARGLVNRLMRSLGPRHPAAPAFAWATAGVAPLRAHFEGLGRSDCSPLWAGHNHSACSGWAHNACAKDITTRLLGGWHSA